MLVYPQLSTGTLTQFPVKKQRRTRTVTNTAADGRKVRLPDPAGGTTEWQLVYADLSDEEAAALEQLFRDAEGSLHSFTFPDPAGNLLAWSGELGNAVWSKGPLVSLEGGIAGPDGRSDAWRMSSNGAGPQGLIQSLNVPSEYLYCLSMYVRSSSTTTVTMAIGPHRAERTVTSEWRRIEFADGGDSGGEPVGFGLEIPAWAEVELFGFQVEAQPGASTYKPTTRGGVYENARLRDDYLIQTATGVNRTSCTVNIIHANHL